MQLTVGAWIHELDWIALLRWLLSRYCMKSASPEWPALYIDWKQCACSSLGSFTGLPGKHDYLEKFQPEKTNNSKICMWYLYRYIIAWFVVIFGKNTTSDISKLLYLIPRAVRRVKFETILKYHERYLYQISRKNHAIICLYYYPQKVCNFHM